MDVCALKPWQLINRLSSLSQKPAGLSRVQTKMAYSATNNINGVLVAMKILGHKKITSTIKYIGDIAYQEDEYEVIGATTVEEAIKLLTAGFIYQVDVCGVKLFRKPKRFSH